MTFHSFQADAMTLSSATSASAKPSRLLAGARRIAARFGTDFDQSPSPPVDRKSIEVDWAKLKRKFEAKRARRKVVYIIHDVYGELGTEEATDLVDEIRETKKFTWIDVVLHTGGGGAIASERVAEALLAHRRTVAYIPNYAISGGTEIALATNRIVLGKHAFLGPTDLQLYGIPAHDIGELESERGIDSLSEELALAAIRARRIVPRDIETVCRLINPAHKKWLERIFPRRCDLARMLSSGEMDHMERITYKRARDLGMNVGKRMPSDVYELVRARRAQMKKLRELEPDLVIHSAMPREGVNESSHRDEA